MFCLTSKELWEFNISCCGYCNLCYRLRPKGVTVLTLNPVGAAQILPQKARGVLFNVGWQTVVDGCQPGVGVKGLH